MSPSTESAATEAASAATESATAAPEACMSHTREAVIALHAGEPAIAGASKRAVILAGILPLKALGSKTFGRRTG
jgi:hypothetical protein